MANDISSKEGVKKTQKSNRLELLQEQADVRYVMNSEAGRRFVWRMLKQTRHKQTVFSSDPLLMAMRSGKQDIGLFLEGQLVTSCPEAYLKMVAEQQPDNGEAAEKQPKNESEVQ